MASCSDDMDLVIPHADNITFSELEIPTRSHMSFLTMGSPLRV